MTEKINKVKVWKLNIDEKVGSETIEAALSDACKEVMQKAYPEGPYGVIERVDIKEKETTVFISGNQRTAEVFSKTLGTYAPHIKLTTLKAAQTDILKFI